MKKFQVYRLSAEDGVLRWVLIGDWHRSMEARQHARDNLIEGYRVKINDEEASLPIELK